MKKILSLTLAALMLLSAVPMVHAADDTGNWGNGTAVSIVGQNDGYTITVPAALEAGETGSVTVSGAWNSKQTLVVSTSDSVAVSYNGQSIDVGITFEGINQPGSDISAFNITKDITLEDVSTTFGTWTGVIEYNVELLSEFTFQITGDAGTFDLTGHTGMTWGEWIDSDYNTIGLEITKGYYVSLIDGETTHNLQYETKSLSRGSVNKDTKMDSTHRFFF